MIGIRKASGSSSKLKSELSFESRSVFVQPKRALHLL